jgi:hypothetical protein
MNRGQGTEGASDVVLSRSSCGDSGWKKPGW